MKINKKIFLTAVLGATVNLTLNAGPLSIDYLPPKANIPDYKPTTITPNELKIVITKNQQLVPAEFEREISLNGTWKLSDLENSASPFPANADLNKGFANPVFDDSSWKTISVPLDWYRKYPQFRKAEPGKKYCAKPYIKGWYRRAFQLDASALKQQQVLLHFGVAPYEALLYINGHKVGTNHGDFTPWEVNITKYLHAGTNIIALRLFSDFGPRFSPSGTDKWTAAGALKTEKGIPATRTYGSQWSLSNIKGGLWQDVSLRFRPEQYFSSLLVSPLLDQSAVRVDYVIENASSNTHKLHLRGAVCSAMKATTRKNIASAPPKTLILQPGTNNGHVIFKLNHPRLWSPAQPYLYYLTAYLQNDSNTVVSATTTRFGYRDFKVKGADFYLNGKRIYLFGENLPSIKFGGLGRNDSCETRLMAEHITGFKRLGYNIIRNPHMPMIPKMLDIADEIGMMLLDEWGWSFTKIIDEPAFERNNRTELTSWVKRDYNHPCVVIWGGGNEVVHRNNPAVKRQLDLQVDRIRALEHSSRPVSNFSGSGSWWSYGKAKLNTDLIDLHSYHGLSNGTWTTWQHTFNITYNETLKTYGRDNKLPLPYIIWECVGFSWGRLYDKKFKLNDINQYAAYTKRETNWGHPNGIGFAGTLGLEAALDSGRGLDYGKCIYGKRILEQLRWNPDIKGFAPWFHGSSLGTATIWTQPVFCGLRYPGSIFLRNVFSSASYPGSFFLVNSSNSAYNNLTVDISLQDATGKTTTVKTLDNMKLSAWEKVTLPLELTIPAATPPGFAQLRVTARFTSQIVSRNFYNIFVQAPAILSSPVKTKLKTAVIATGGKGQQALEKILKTLKIPYVKLKPSADFSVAELLIVPPVFPGEAVKLPPAQKLLSFARQGKTLLVLAQSDSGLTLLPGQVLINAPNTFVDIALPAHPVFGGLTQRNFDTWNNPDNGYAINFMLDPFTLNALAVRGPLLGKTRIGSAISEAIFGKGRIFQSQLNAVALWGKDSAASTYLRNLLSYLASGAKPSKLVKPLKMAGTQAFPVSITAKNAVFIDLKPYANRGFADDVPDDHKGGWTDQGNNDFRMMPTGRQECSRIPFEIINPTENNGKSCLILRGIARPYFPKRIDDIKVNQKLARLYFLHTSAWGSGKTIACYRIHYNDGTNCDFLAVDGRNIGDWWEASSLPEARLGLSRTNRFGKPVGAFVAVWENPHPQKTIKSIDFITGGEAVPILIALTGEAPAANPLIIEDAANPVDHWRTLAWKGGDKPKVSHENSSDSPSGKTIKIAMPAPRNGGTPVVFKCFPKAKLSQHNYRFLSFWIKAEKGSSINIVLPSKDWKQKLSATIVLGNKTDRWHHVRLNLDTDMRHDKNKSLKLKNLKGEFFIYNKRYGKTKHPEAVFYLDKIILE